MAHEIVGKTCYLVKEWPSCSEQRIQVNGEKSDWGSVSIQGVSSDNGKFTPDTKITSTYDASVLQGDLRPDE